MNKLSEITFDNLKNAIDNTISNKIFVRNHIIENMPGLTKNEQITVIYKIFFEPSSISLIKTINNIEWTPVKLYLTGYYIVNLYGNFWLVSHNSHEGFVTRSYITFNDYIDILFKIVNNLNVTYLNHNYGCTDHDLIVAINTLKHTPDKHIIFIKQILFVNSPIILHHYIYKNGNEFYYFPLANNAIYKPFLCSIKC